MTHDFFFYGTLMDQDVTRAVLNRETLMFEVGILAGFEVRKIVGKSYPALAPRKGSQVIGVLLRDLNLAEQRALGYYEGDEYQIETISVILPCCDQSSPEIVPANVFCPKGDLRLEKELWSYLDWQAKDKVKMLSDLRNEMKIFWSEFNRTGHARLHPSAPSKIRGDVKS